MEIEVWSLKSMNIESRINISTFDVYNNGSFCIENSCKKLLNNNNNQVWSIKEGPGKRMTKTISRVELYVTA